MTDHWSERGDLRMKWQSISTDEQWLNEDTSDTEDRTCEGR